MEAQLKFWDALEDSGCLTFEDNFSGNLYYSETPVLASSNITRKRKIGKIRSFNEYRELPRRSSLAPDSPAIFENSVSSSNFLSSTLNESLSKSLENCSISGFTSNLYPDSSSGEFDSKRMKYENTPKYEPTTRSAPSSPTKHLEVEELKGKSYSDHLHKTPQKTQSSRLGSPECMELLYPTLTATKTSPKIKTPEKLRDFLRKINSPAKKRLFEIESNKSKCDISKVKRKIIRKTRCDPVPLFCVKNDFRHIMSEIFSYLSDEDLCSVNCVSKSWRKALNNDRAAQLRFHFYTQQTNLNKENIVFRKDVVHVSTSLTTPGSPIRDYFHKCTKIASTLLPNQSLLKCTRCMSPAIKQKSVSQCQNPNCEYIYCVNCLSFSTTGPDDFVDKCNSSELKFNNHKRSCFSLYDKSNGGNDPPSFLVNDSLNTPQTYDSSGYFSGTDNTPIIKKPLIMQTKPNGISSAPLKDNNSRRHQILYLHKSRRSSLVPVVSPQKKYKNQDIIEPSSPPRNKVVACSKQSKKNLRRLQL